MAKQLDDSRSILFITLSNIGDAILTTPTLALLNNAFPKATIDIIGDKRSLMLFQHCPYRGDLYAKQKQKLLRGSVDLVCRLRNKRYDLIVDLRTDVLPCLLRGRIKYSRRHGRALTHAVQRHASVVQAFLSAVEIPPTQLWLSSAQTQFAAEQLSDLSGNRFLAVGPGANWDKKIWPCERYAELCSQLGEQYDALIVLGSQADAVYADVIMQACGLPGVNLCGKSSLLQAAAVLAKCQLFIGNDSGLGHLASAVGTATYTLFGPGEPQRYHPWGDRAAWYVQAEHDIRRIEVQQVKQSLQQHLQNLSRKRP